MAWVLPYLEVRGPEVLDESLHWVMLQVYSHHETVLFAIVSHQDDVPVGGPDETSQFEGVLRAGRSRLHRGNLIGLNAAQLRGGV